MLLPSEANLNDAKIMEWALGTGLEDSLEPADDCFVDRGFRDVKGALGEKGFYVRMPICMTGQNKQLTTAQANESVRISVEIEQRLFFSEIGCHSSFSNGWLPRKRHKTWKSIEKNPLTTLDQNESGADGFLTKKIPEKNHT